MSRLLTAAGLVLLVAGVLWFAALNGAQRVTIDLGFITLYYVPVTLVAFGALLAGMLIMFVAGIRSDLKVRKILRDRFDAQESPARVGGSPISSASELREPRDPSPDPVPSPSDLGRPPSDLRRRPPSPALPSSDPKSSSSAPTSPSSDPDPPPSGEGG